MSTYTPFFSSQVVQKSSVRPASVTVSVSMSSVLSAQLAHEPADGVDEGVELGVDDGVLEGVDEGVEDGVLEGVLDGLEALQQHQNAKAPIPSSGQTHAASMAPAMISQRIM